MSLTGKPSLTTASPITNDGFWRDVSMADLMSKYRIPSEYADDTIKWGLSLAVIRVNEALERAKTVMQDDGFATFDDYLTAHPNGVADSELLQIHYEAAVYSRAKANLLQQFSTMNRRKDAENEAKESEQVEQYWLDESASSVAAILSTFFPLEFFAGKADVHVSLI